MVFVVRQPLEMCRGKDIELLATFVDLSKSLDSVKRIELCLFPKFYTDGVLAAPDPARPDQTRW